VMPHTRDWVIVRKAHVLDNHRYYEPLTLFRRDVGGTHRTEVHTKTGNPSHSFSWVHREPNVRVLGLKLRQKACQLGLCRCGLRPPESFFPAPQRQQGLVGQTPQREIASRSDCSSNCQLLANARLVPELRPLLPVCRPLVKNR
jgi:hypothetical protein